MEPLVLSENEDKGFVGLQTSGFLLKGRLAVDKLSEACTSQGQTVAWSGPQKTYESV